MIRTVAKELHATPLPDNKHELKTGTTTMKPNHHPPQRQKKGYQQWVLAISLVAFVVLILSRNQVAQNLDFDTDTDVEREETVHPKIRQISILGERNSGTRWTFEHISECFGHALKVEKKLTRYKHWLQYDDPTQYPHDTLVLAQFRNPYDWLKAMEHVPHHSPAHLRTALGANTSLSNSANDWKIFLTKPWTTERAGKDLLLYGNETCQDNFKYKDVVSCHLEPLPKSHYDYTLRYSEHQPFYEMRNDGSGEPYPNIMELRTDKIRNFLSVAQYEGIADVWAIQYEYLLNMGTAHLLDRIQEWTGVEPKCEPKEAQQRKPKKSRMLAPEFARFIRQNLNWTVEGWIGFDVELKREEEGDQW